MAGESRQVTIGGQVRTIEKFSGRKVAVSIKVLKRLATTYKTFTDEMADFRKDYAEKRPVRLTVGQVAMNVAELRGAIGSAASDPELEPDVKERAVRDLTETANAYQSLLDGPLKERDFVERPGIPTAEEQMYAAIPLLMENADEELAKLLGLALMTNHEVGEARKAGNLDEKMDTIGNDALDVGDIDECIEAIGAAAEMLLGDLRSRKERLGKIGALFRIEAEEEGEAQESQTTATLTSTSGRPTGSTDSPAPTDGTPTTPSTESPTDSEPASSPA